MITVKSCAQTNADPKAVENELMKKILDSPMEQNLFKEALRVVQNTNEAPENLGNILISTLPNEPTFQSCRNWMFQHKAKTAAHLRFEWIMAEPSTNGSWSYLQKAQRNWERKMLRSLNSMCQELGIRLAGKRDMRQNEAILENWTELSLVFNKTSAIKPVYGPKDLLEVLIYIRHPNTNLPLRGYNEDNTNGHFPYWGLFNLPMRVKDITELSKFYHPLSMEYSQCGIDELFSTSFAKTREQEAEDILRTNSSEAAQTYLKQGCPLGFRAQMWALYLDANVTEEDARYYEYLKMRIAEEESMTDLLICKEVQLIASNDEMHFVFCDYTYQVLLPFTRDATVREHFRTTIASPPKVVDKQNSESSIFPPSGVIPFHGFSMYVLPLCYLYDDPVTLYVIFRQLYIRYFHKLHAISNDSSGILGLCVLFERLLQAREPQVFFHLRSHGIQPVRFVFKWLMRAFSGFLTPDQVLLLWDRILGFDSLEILAVLAVAIFSYRRANLLLVNNAAGVEAILADLTPLKIVSLLQLVLFTRN